jgi:hypothetical protein
MEASGQQELSSHAVVAGVESRRQEVTIEPDQAKGGPVSPSVLQFFEQFAGTGRPFFFCPHF